MDRGERARSPNLAKIPGPTQFLSAQKGYMSRMAQPTGSTWAGRTDGDLLAAFVHERQDEAFAEIVRRHGGLVLSVCRSVLGNGPDAEDAAQAAFVTLVKKAGALQSHPTLGGWLHRVAWYVSNHARRAAGVRQRHEREAAQMDRNRYLLEPESESPIELLPDRMELLHEGLSQLPEKYRLPLILHHLEGRTQEEVAVLLGSNVGTISARLTRGRQLLRERLARKGVTASMPILLVMMSAEASASVPPTFVAAATQFASAAMAGQVAMSVSASGHVVALANSALHMLYVAKMKLPAMLAAAILLASATVASTYLALAASRGSLMTASAAPAAGGCSNQQRDSSGTTEGEKAAVPPKGAPRAGWAPTLWTTSREGKLPVPGALRVYHIGNSLTAGLYSYGRTEKLFSDRGVELVRGQHIKWGKSLPWMREHPEINDAPVLPFRSWQDELTENTWDVLILQPFGATLDGPQGDLAACRHFVETAAKRSPAIQVYVLATWPQKTGGKDFTQFWDRPSDDKPVPMGVPCRAYCERLVEQLNLACTALAKPVRIIPLGDVLRGLDAAAKAKSIPGVANAWQLYRDDINLGPLGCYAAKCTLFAVLAGRSPVGLRSGPMKPEEQAAVRKVEEITWQVVTTYPLTGVTPPRNP